MSVDAHFFYYYFEDCFLRVLLSLSLGYDVVVPVRRTGPVQYMTIRLKENYLKFRKGETTLSGGRKADR